jgi:hypothetical protein
MDSDPDRVDPAGAVVAVAPWSRSQKRHGVLARGSSWFVPGLRADRGRRGVVAFAVPAAPYPRPQGRA